MFTPARSARGMSVAVPMSSPGGNSLVKDPFINLVPPTTSSLSVTTMGAVLAELYGHGITPTSEMIEGLRDTARTLERMAEDILSPQFCLSSLDPGVRKTTLVRHFIRVLLASPFHDEVSVLLCVSRLDEVKGLIKALPSQMVQHVGVLTACKETNQLAGTPMLQEARVLVTTQQMVQSRCRGRRFAEVEDFLYRGSTRRVKIWDEAFLPGEVVTLTTDDLASLVKPVRNTCNDLANGIDTLRDRLCSARPGSRILVPALADLGGPLALSALRALSREARGDLQQAAQALLGAAGQCLPVHRATNGINLLLDYRDTIPADLAPMVILDASGRCRHTYRLMETGRGNLVRLKEVTRDYGNLKVHVWLKGGGKSSFRRDHEETRLRGIAQTMSGKLKEEWLVIHHMDQGAGPGFAETLLPLLAPEMRNRVHFLHWGNHHGTNAYAHVRNVVLAGTLFLPEYSYEGLVRLTAALPGDEVIRETNLSDLKLGEYAHAILQALCRGSVRGTGPDGRCKPCNAYIIADPRSGIPRLLPRLFPGCQLGPWKPLPDKVTGTVQRALDMVDRLLIEDDGFREIITYKELQAALGMMDSTNFRKTVRNKESFRNGIAERGLEETEVRQGGRILKGLWYIQSAFPPAEG